MDASQYKDYVLVLLFVKYVSDKYAGDPNALINVPAGGSFADMVAAKEDKEIGAGRVRIVANRGGRTCRAAIIARELGVPAIVGCDHATTALQEGESVTVSCAEGDTGFVYHGKLPFEVVAHGEEALPQIPVKLMLNVDQGLTAECCNARPDKPLVA